MDYIIASTPEYFNSYRTLKKKEVEEFFQWYLEQSENRIRHLKDYFNSENEGKCKLDDSPESFIDLWEWFETEVIFVPRDIEEIEKQKEESPEWFREYVPETEFSAYTLSLILDIAYYFADVFIKFNPDVHWGYFTKPKNRASVNSPVLLGFKNDMDLDPRLIVSNCAYPSQNGWNKNELFDVYNVWVDMIV